MERAAVRRDVREKVEPILNGHKAFLQLLIDSGAPKEEIAAEILEIKR